MYFLTMKSKVFEVFKRFKAMVEKEINMLIKFVRYDR